MRAKQLTQAVAAALLAYSSLASAANSSAMLTADDEFWLYSGNATGSSLQYIGTGSSWTTLSSFSFDANPGDYLYVMARDVWGSPHAWQGKFTVPVGTVYTDTASWVATAVGSTTVNQTVISGAIWTAVTTELPNGSGPWGAIVPDANAKWIWNSDVYAGDTTVLFRTASVVAVPEPETYAMLLAGLGVVGWLGRRRRGAPR